MSLSFFVLNCTTQFQNLVGLCRGGKSYMWIPSKVVSCGNDLHSSVSSNLTAYDKLKEDVGSAFFFFWRGQHVFWNFFGFCMKPWEDFVLKQIKITPTFYRKKSIYL